MTKIAIALGSNLGDRRAHLNYAVDRLRAILDNVRVSAFIDTAPVDVPDEQPHYLNAVLVGETSLAPETLLDELLAIERARGRTRPSVRASRTLDLDLVLYGDQILKTVRLEVPHPRFREREFVLGPLREIAPEWRDPVTGRTVAELRIQNSEF